MGLLSERQRGVVEMVRRRGGRMRGARRMRVGDIGDRKKKLVVLIGIGIRSLLERGGLERERLKRSCM